MKAIRYHRYGGPEELRLEEADRPEPKEGQVRVRVRAASVNPMDWKIRRGEMKLLSGFRFPRGLGHDFAGVIDAVGAGVTPFKVGDAVIGATAISQAGTFADYVVADAKNIWIKPEAVPFIDAAALTIVGMTAWNALVSKAKLGAGQSIFIGGCLGNVGRSAVQIARARGAMVAGSCSADGFADAAALGVSEAVDYRTLDVARFQDRFDVVFDTAGALSLGQCGVMLRQGGMSLHIVPNFAKMIGALFSSRHNLVFGNPTPESLAGITAAAERGELVAAIGATVPLSEAIPAIVELETTGLPKGKLVVFPD